jgi:four helix bundle protein
MLVSQMLRSSRSVTNNICEGYGRFTYTDTRHFFIQARGSVFELMDQLTIAFDEKYIIEEQLKEIEKLSQTVAMLINGYIAYLDRQATNP